MICSQLVSRWGLQGLHSQGSPSTGHLPFLLLQSAQPASDPQPLVSGLPCGCCSHQLALSALAVSHRPTACSLSSQHAGSRNLLRSVFFRQSAAGLAPAQASSAAQHLGCISDCTVPARQASFARCSAIHSAHIIIVIIIIIIQGIDIVCIGRCSSSNLVRLAHSCLLSIDTYRLTQKKKKKSSSSKVHEGDASFLARHLMLTCFTLFGQVMWVKVGAHFHLGWCMRTMHLF